MTNDLLTPDEHHAMGMTVKLWNHLSRNVVGGGPGREGDMRELMFHIHGIQRAILAQAACRAYPEKYRLLGGDSPDGEELVQQSWESFEGYTTPAAPTHSCSCHVNGNECGVCRDLECPIAMARDAAKQDRESSEDSRTDEQEVDHILTVVTDQPVCMTPKEEIGFVKAAAPKSTDSISCRACRDILSTMTATLE